MRNIRTIYLFSAILIVAPVLSPFEGKSQNTANNIQLLLETEDLHPRANEGGLLQMSSRDECRRFYSRNHFAMAWTDEKKMDELLLAIRSIEADGLNPKNYNLASLERLRPAGIQDQAALRDVAFTDAFLELAHDLHQGRLDPVSLFPGDWELSQPPVDYAGLLTWALHDVGVCETLDLLRPMDDGYEGLKYMLSRFRQIRSSANFPEITPGPAIEPNSVDDRLVLIRRKLSLLGLIPAELDNEDVRYDSVLIFAIQRFQRMHGLFPDGTIGPRTQQAMALSADDYIEAISANLERYRWHRSNLLERCIKINIPGADLTVSEGGSTELTMRAIIGRPDRRTPVLSSSLTSITINPYWTIPPTVLKEDVLPAIKADPTYLQRHNIRVIASNGREIHPDSIDWAAVKSGSFPYTLREDPGARNPLGLIKFYFPNKHTVYLHDTNTPSLFGSPERTLSSGCIRIEAPMKLLRMILPGSGWTEDMVHDQIQLGETKNITLKDPIPIHIVYFTAYVKNNEFYMLRDPYGYDRVVFDALNCEIPIFR